MAELAWRKLATRVCALEQCASLPLPSAVLPLGATDSIHQVTQARNGGASLDSSLSPHCQCITKSQQLYISNSS